MRALLSQHDRVLSSAAAEIEHALAAHVTAEPKVHLCRNVGPVPHRVERLGQAVPRGNLVPRVRVHRLRILAADPLLRPGLTALLRTPPPCGALRRRGTAPAATS